MELVRTPEERFADLPGFPFDAALRQAAGGLRMHYVDEGPPGAEAVLLLHGQPTWSLPLPHRRAPAWRPGGCAPWRRTWSGSGVRTSPWPARPTRSGPTSNG